MFKAHDKAERERRRDGKEGGTEREEGGMGRPRLFDPIITSGTTARDQISRKKRRGADTDGDTANSSLGWSENSNLQL